MKKKWINVIIIILFAAIEWELVKDAVIVQFAWNNSHPSIAANMPLSPKEESFALKNSRFPEISKLLARQIIGTEGKDASRMNLAVELVNNSIKANPLDAEAYYIKAQIMSSGRPNADVRPYLEKAVKLDPKSMQYNLALARYLKEAEDPAAAEAIYKSLISSGIPIMAPTLSKIYCDLAQISMVMEQDDAFQAYVERARELDKKNWQAALLLAGYYFLKGKNDKGIESFRESYRTFRDFYANNQKEAATFSKRFQSLVAGMIRNAQFEDLRNLYSVYVLQSPDIEKTLFEIKDDYVGREEIAKRIFGGPIRAILFDPKISPETRLLNMRKGCSSNVIEHRIERNSGSEIIDIEYASSAVFLDLWYLPVNITINSPSTSIMMIVESDEPIENRQLTFEVLGRLYYSKSVTTQIKPHEYKLLAQNIKTWIYDALLLKPKNYNITLSKIGLNTVCRSGRYGIKEISLYLE